MLLLIYILTMKGGRKERWEPQAFNEWLTAQGEKVDATFAGRRDQFRRYTGQNVVDWEMEDQ